MDQQVRYGYSYWTLVITCHFQTEADTIASVGLHVRKFDLKWLSIKMAEIPNRPLYTNFSTQEQREGREEKGKRRKEEDGEGEEE